MSNEFDHATSEMDKLVRRWEEDAVAKDAVYEFRKKNLMAEIDSLVLRVEDCEALIAEGKYTHERALEFIKPQIERVAAYKAVFVDEGAQP